MSAPTPLPSPPPLPLPPFRIDIDMADIGWIWKITDQKGKRITGGWCLSEGWAYRKAEKTFARLLELGSSDIKGT